jgi:peptide/nickel transport system substrate-binding protein
VNPRSTLLATLAVAGTLLTAGCGGSSSGGGTTPASSTPATTATTAPAGDGAQHRGGTLTMLWNSSGSSIDTAVDYDPNWFVLRMTSDGLVAWKQVAGTEGNQLVPDLALAVPKPTDGGKTYKFTLRPGIRYSTGRAVKASDVRATLTRQFAIPGPGVGFYSGLVGGARCASKPKACDLSRGIVTDDAARTVTFKLTAPDPDFLQKLAMPFAWLVPAGTPAHDTGVKPLPATGPYMIERYTPNQQLVLTRNPNFKEWSHDAQPAGNPDRIVMKIGLSLEDATTQVANGQADWMYDNPPADRLDDVATKYPKQIHVNTTPQVYYMAMNVNVAPFDNKDVRQALNLATDRRALVQLYGGPKLASATCQTLPPGFPGYEAYCPYTADPGTKWSAPDLARAKQLIDGSGTKGTKVTVIGTPDETSKSIDLYFVSLLRQLGYKASLKTLSNSVQYPYVQDSRNEAQISLTYWSPDYNAASNFLNIAFGCNGYHAASTASPNLSGFCDKGIQAQTDKALALQATDIDAANTLWAQVDHATTDAAPAVELFVANKLDFVSARVGNFQFSPSVVGRFLIDQAWVQ